MDSAPVACVPFTPVRTLLAPYTIYGDCPCEPIGPDLTGCDWAMLHPDCPVHAEEYAQALADERSDAARRERRRIRRRWHRRKIPAACDLREAE